MSPQSPTQAKQAESRRLFIILIAAIVAMICMGMGMVVVFLATSGDAQEQDDWERPQPPAVTKRIEAPAIEPVPTPLGDNERGYGRPEPLFGGADAHDGAGDDAHDGAHSQEPIGPKQMGVTDKTLANDRSKA